MTNDIDSPSQPGTHVKSAVEALDDGIRAATAYERPDLAVRLEGTRRRLLEPDVQVVVIGEFKQGKSSLINALLNSPICPVDDDIATAVPTSIRHGEDRAAWALVAPPGSKGGDDVKLERRAIDFNLIPDFATEQTADPDLDVRGVEIELKRRLLDDGLVLVDTPGVGGLGSAHATAALGALSVADAAIFLSDASQEYTQTEMGFLKQALDMCPHVTCLITKTDFYPAWRKVRELNEAHLKRAGHDIEILPVSSTLRMEAIKRDNKELNAESGFPALIAKISHDVVGGASTREHAKARHDLIAVTEQLIGQFDAELTALNDPEARAELMSRLEDATVKSERLRSQAAKWSVTLNDGVGDLTANVDFDFRARLRTVTAEADPEIEASDPMETWSEF
jgi:signal recognition particle receptor subunit beta